MKLIPKTVKGKIFLFIGGIAIISGLAIGFYTYWEELSLAKKASKEKAKLTITFAKATREYVRGVLRPRIYELLNKYSCIKEDFILEAQSSSFVTNKIFEKVSENLRGLILRQVAFKPLNPKDNPNQVEAHIIKLFRTKKLPEYFDIVDVNNYRYLVYAYPVKVKASCLHCHGKRETMPEAIKKLYNPPYDPDWKVGSIQGGVFIYEPYEATILKAHLSGIIKGGVVFFLNLIVIGMVLFILNRYVFKPIEVLKEHADKISKGEIDDKIPISSEDEIGQLAKAFERMRISIKKVMDILK